MECEKSEDSGVLRGEGNLQGMKWGLWCVKCRVWSVKCRVLSVYSVCM